MNYTGHTFLEHDTRELGPRMRGKWHLQGSAVLPLLNHPVFAVVVGPGKVAGQPLLRGSTQHLALLEVWEEF